MAKDYSFLKEYPLDYLISNKDKQADLYTMLRNNCVYLLDGHNPDEAEVETTWGIFKLFFLFGMFSRDRVQRKILKAFADNFNHSEESPVEFFLWFLSDMINELDNDVDWQAVPQPFIDTSILGIKRTSRVPSGKVKLFFQKYVSQGGGRIPRPSWNDMQSFAKVTLQFIEEPKVKECLEKQTFGRFGDLFFSEDIHKTLDVIGKLTLRDGEMLVAAKPLLENFRDGYFATHPSIIDLSAKDMQEPRSVNPEIEERQKQVFELKQYGHDDKYVANALGVGIKTIQRDKKALGILKPRQKGH